MYISTYPSRQTVLTKMAVSLSCTQVPNISHQIFGAD
jgi:hypothetical protein